MGRTVPRTFSVSDRTRKPASFVRGESGSAAPCKGLPGDDGLRVLYRLPYRLGALHNPDRLGDGGKSVTPE